MSEDANAVVSATEEAFLYDLAIAPLWREVFNEILDEEVQPPEGTILDAGCGTGDYAIGLAVALGSKGNVLGIDPSEARLNLARAKATLKKLDNVTFTTGSVQATGVRDESFDLVIGDLSWLANGEIGAALTELRRAAAHDATVAVFTSTRGSFDEFHSVYWEALHEEDLLDYWPHLEALITARPTVAEFELLARGSGLRRVHSVTQKHGFDFEDATAFLSAPLISSYFLPAWLGILESSSQRDRFLKTLATVIDRARDRGVFDVSIKATVVMGTK